MSFKSNLVKMAIKCSPDAAVIWVANKILKGIAELTEFQFDLDTRSVYAQTILFGETEAIEVWLDDFAIINGEDGSKRFIVNKAKANKPWLNNVFAKVVGKAWKIPSIPQISPYLDLLAELLPPMPSEDGDEVNADETKRDVSD